MTLALGLQRKQRHGKVRTENVTRECEGMNPHTPKWIPTLGVGIPMEFQVFKKVFQGSKLIRLNKFFNIIENLLKLKCLKEVRMTHLST